MGWAHGQPGRTAAAAFLALIASGFLLSGCDTTSYRQPVASFASGAGAAQAALVEIDKQAAAKVAAIYRDRAVKGQAFLDHKADECTVGATRCRLTVTIQSQEREVPPDSPLRNTIAVMGQVAVYAQGLNAIVTADTAEQAKSDVNATLGSAQDLARLVAELGGGDLTSATVPEFATPVGEAVNWLLGAYVEHVKLEGLRRATSDANPIIQEAAEVAGAEAAIAGDIQRRSLSELVSARLDAFDESRTEANYDALLAAAAAYDAFLTSAPDDVFQQMAQAHDALTRSLQDRSLSLADVAARISTFERQAQDLWRIAQALAQIGAGQEGVE
ncbi:MAG: hypothetical protein IRY94_06785 [Rhodospirillaceae bacterium]|nr:hypothetical protein [Rhodospirillaceae bacterium]